MPKPLKDPGPPSEGPARIAPPEDAGIHLVLDSVSEVSAGADVAASADATEKSGLEQTQAAPSASEKAAHAAAPAEATPASKVKVKQLGDFRLVEKLGAGGMGVVFKAQQISMERDVALKVLSKHLAENADFVQRFQREARLMGRLEHPNILRCYCVGEEHGYHYFAMEFADGGTMEAWLQKLGKLSVGDALHVALRCAEALQYAHEMQLVHRDIKPDNVLLTRKGGVKLADLGLAKALTEDVSLTRTGTGAGTPVYMSPEQARDVKHVDGKSDIYSLGCMLYCFLTGRPPFTGETYVELLEAKQKAKYPPARRFNEDVPPRLDLVIDKMLVVDPAARYQTCAELIRDLQALGMENRSLGFLEPAAAGKARPDKKPAAAPPGPTRPAVIAPPPARPEGPARPAPAGDYWYISYTSRDGRPVTRKLLTAQVLEMLRNGELEGDAAASRDRDEGYRALGTYREFEHFLRGKRMKARADRKAAEFHSVYQKLVKEAQTREKKRWFHNLVLRTGGGFVFLLWLVFIIAAVSGLVFVAVKWVIPAVGGWFEHLLRS